MKDVQVQTWNSNKIIQNYVKIAWNITKNLQIVNNMMKFL